MRLSVGCGRLRCCAPHSTLHSTRLTRSRKLQHARRSAHTGHTLSHTVHTRESTELGVAPTIENQSAVKWHYLETMGPRALCGLCTTADCDTGIDGYGCHAGIVCGVAEKNMRMPPAVKTISNTGGSVSMERGPSRSSASGNAYFKHGGEREYGAWSQPEQCQWQCIHVAPSTSARPVTGT